MSKTVVSRKRYSSGTRIFTEPHLIEKWTVHKGFLLATNEKIREYRGCILTRARVDAREFGLSRAQYCCFSVRAWATFFVIWFLALLRLRSGIASSATEKFWLLKFACLCLFLQLYGVTLLWSIFFFVIFFWKWLLNICRVLGLLVKFRYKYIT